MKAYISKQFIKCLSSYKLKKTVFKILCFFKGR